MIACATGFKSQARCSPSCNTSLNSEKQETRSLSFYAIVWSSDLTGPQVASSRGLHTSKVLRTLTINLFDHLYVWEVAPNFREIANLAGYSNMKHHLLNSRKPIFGQSPRLMHRENVT